MKFWPTYPLFAKQNFFRTWQTCCRIWHSCFSEVLKNVTNRFLVPKNLYNQIFRSFRLLVQDLRSFYGFFEKNSTAVISVSVFRCSRFTENRSPPTVFKISTCGLRHFTHNWIAYKLFETGFWIFASNIFKGFSKLKKNSLWLWRAVKKYWDKNLKIFFQQFVNNDCK